MLLLQLSYLGCLVVYSKRLKLFFSNLLTLSVPDEGYPETRRAHQNRYLSLFLKYVLLSRGRYLCWWDINPRGYHPPSQSVPRS